MSTTRRRRPAAVTLTLVATGGCLGLAWWQWSRFESTAGDFQNLGYALQWPLFAGFCVYAYRKYVRYEEVAPLPRRGDEVTEIPAGMLPERPRSDGDAPDPALREYNAYLRHLAEADTEQKGTR